MKADSIALALTWDGSRWPVAKLPAAARKFLNVPGLKATPKQLSEILRAGRIKEIRICWVPILRGGDEVLCSPFATKNGRRIPFRQTSSRPLGDALGVVYRR